MGMWSKCIKKCKAGHVSPFAESNLFAYTYTRLYLGAKGEAVTANGNLAFLMSFSIRDGIFVKFKRQCPYRVLFDYADGAYYVNDVAERGYDKLIISLLQFQKTPHNDDAAAYSELEGIVYDFVISAFAVHSNNSGINQNERG